MPQPTLSDLISSPLVTLPSDAPLSLAARSMGAEHVSALLVLQEGSPPGLVTERDLLLALSRDDRPDTPLVRLMSTPVISAKGTLAMSEGYHLLTREGIRHLLVTHDDGSPLGVLDESDFRRNLEKEYLLRVREIGEQMTTNVVTLAANATVGMAADLMAQHRISCIVITDQGCPLGIITERDMVRLSSDGPGVKHRQLGDVMSTPLITVREELALHEAAAMMQQHDLRRLVVVDQNGGLSGILTEHDLLNRLQGEYLDLLRKLSQEQASEIAQVKEALSEQVNRELIRRLVLESTHEGICGVDSEGVCTFANPAAARLLGLERPEQLVGELLHSIAHHSHADGRPYPRADCPTCRTCTTGEVVEVEDEVFWRVDGSSFMVSYRSYPIYHSGRLDGGVLVFQDRTEAHHYLNKLKQSEGRLQTLIQTIPDLVWLKEPAGRYLACNPAFERFSTIPEAELLGKTDYDIVSVEVADSFRANDLAAIEANGPRTNEEWVTWASDGHRSLFETTKTPMYDADGGLIGVLGVARDITELKRDREQLTASSSALEFMIHGRPLDYILEHIVLSLEQQSPDMRCSILLLDSVGRHLQHGAAPSLPADYVNAIDGVAIGPAVGSCGTAAFTGQAVFVRDIATDPLWEGYRDLATVHGLRACWSLPITSSTGKIMGTFAVYYSEPRDASPDEIQLVENSSQLAAVAIENSRAKEALQQSESRFRALFEQVAVGVAQIDTQSGRFIQINLRYCDILGYSHYEMMGLDFQSITHPDDLNADLQQMAQLIAGEISHFSMEKRYYRKDGSTVWVNLSVTPMWKPGEQPAFHIAVVEDITLRKIDETRLTEQLGELQRWHDVTLGREMRILELKAEINALLDQDGKSPRYPSVLNGGSAEVDNSGLPGSPDEQGGLG